MDCVRPLPLRALTGRSINEPIQLLPTLVFCDVEVALIIKAGKLQRSVVKGKNEVLIETATLKAVDR